ncbi:MAG: hypothetical protein E4G99_12125, partial [Anaerolineales bacterium]
MITYRDFTRALEALDIRSHSRVILHAAIEPFGEVAGAQESLIGALINTCEFLITPAFTHQTMIIPGVGPPDNAIEYGSADEANLEAAVFDHEEPVDGDLGVVNEGLRQHPRAERSSHPILSFVGFNASEALAS